MKLLIFTRLNTVQNQKDVLTSEDLTDYNCNNKIEKLANYSKETILTFLEIRTLVASERQMECITLKPLITFVSIFQNDKMTRR